MRISAGIFFSLILSVLVSVSYAQVKETIVNEHFYSNNLGWPEDAVNDYSSNIKNGTYFLKYNKEGGSHTFDIATDLNPGRNFFIETSGRLLESNKDGGFGIVWGKGRTGFYSFVVSSNGSYFIREARADGNNKYLVKPTLNRNIRKGGLTNKLRVQFHPEVYEFFVNDSFLVRIPFRKFYGDNTGLVLYGRQEAEISDFGVFGSRKYLAVSTKPIKLTISAYSINDGIDNDGTKLGNDNSRINSGESVKMRVSLKNTGNYTAQSLSVYVSSENPKVRVFDANKKISLPTANPNEVANFMFKFYVVGDYGDNDVAFKIDIVDRDGHLSETMSFKVPVNTSLPSIDRKDNNLSLTINVKERPTDDVNSGFPTTFVRSDQTYAVIIGVENYTYLPKAQFAAHDAAIFYNYLVKVLNVPRHHILLVTDYNASKATIANFFSTNGRLVNLVSDRAEHIIFYFSGLGTIEPQSSAPYILLSDSRADNAASGYPVSEIINSLHRFRSKSVICFFETSFSGVTRSGEAFEKNGGTFWNLPSLPIISSANSEMALFYASAGEQPNPVYEPSQHGLFTHCLLSTIKTSAFSNSALTMKNLFSIVSREMMKECTKRGITVVPKIDCIYKDDITILK